MKLRLHSVVVCLVLTRSADALADDASDVQSLLNEQVIVTAASTARRESSAPAVSTTITAEELKGFGFRTLAQAIDFLAQGVYTGDSLRTPDVGSHGVLFTNDNGRHFLLQLNGHAINDPLYGAARFDAGAGIPIDVIDHIEVVIGPGSVLYGSNAMMGVVNVITKDAGTHQGVHVYGDNEIGRSFRVGAGAGYRFKTFGAPSELTLGVEYYDRYGPNLEFPRVTIPVMQVPGLTAPSSIDWGGRLDKGYFTHAPSRCEHQRLRIQCRLAGFKPGWSDALRDQCNLVVRAGAQTR